MKTVNDIRILEENSISSEIISAAIEARRAGKDWIDALAVAKNLGYQGGSKSFKTVVEANLKSTSNVHTSEYDATFISPTKALMDEPSIATPNVLPPESQSSERDAEYIGTSHITNPNDCASGQIEDGLPPPPQQDLKSLPATDESDANSGGILPEVVNDLKEDANIDNIITTVTARAHVLANMMPMMPMPALKAMASDILAKGLLAPIVMLAGMILDGRNRSVACILTGVEPRYIEFESLGVAVSPVEWVISQNIQRRHLTTGQLAMIGAKIIPELEKEAKCRQGVRTDLQPEKAAECGRSADTAAASVGVSSDSIKSALKVLKTGAPEVQASVMSGRITLNAAVRLAELPPDEQRLIVAADAKTMKTALRNSKPPDEYQNVIDRYPELESKLRAEIKNNPKIGKEDLEKKAEDLVAAKQNGLADNKNKAGKPGSRMPEKNSDYDKAAQEVAANLESANREVKADLQDQRLVLRFPFPPSANHIANSLRDLDPKLKASLDKQLTTGIVLVIEVHINQEGH